jgi:CHAT domain-containing protein
LHESHSIAADIGAGRAFLYAGAHGLLASHWRVADEATAALTVETLAAAKADPALGRAGARQAAMRTIRTGRRADGSAVFGWSPAWRHPAAWAPFSIYAASGD